ncbi:hypothetical protein CYMTET_40792 [Cymbomonas tetramitiformis]|uniref:Uncharacterized protein n=1 Tax=Cymbomonas tetramitiformis TaxID=36881 RepID=A0AAE0C9E2_9CHLO|nr:hypothetical protein CYMTET_40792 [Cymbomonas tetramitiformis]|eukprot:gene2903-3714_t
MYGREDYVGWEGICQDRTDQSNQDPRRLGSRASPRSPYKKTWADPMWNYTSAYRARGAVDFVVERTQESKGAAGTKAEQVSRPVNKPFRIPKLSDTVRLTQLAVIIAEQ